MNRELRSTITVSILAFLLAVAILLVYIGAVTWLITVSLNIILPLFNVTKHVTYLQGFVVLVIAHLLMGGTIISIKK